MSRRALGVLLAAIAAATSVSATFLPLSWIGTSRGGDRFGLVTTGWGTDTAPATMDGIGPQAQIGVPIVIAAVLLVLAAALVHLPAHQRLAGRYTAVAATALLIGSVWTTFMTVSARLSPNSQDERLTITYEYGAGMWLLVAACVVAIVATVYLHARPPVRTPAPGGVIVHRLDDDVDADTDTPPFGISVPVLPENHLGQAAPPAGPDPGAASPERTT
ncbi:hypothetical protein [Actinosynnema sp. NPDC023587]|uniref:hypothetical protein n=1 Tax=Actinosynnema sp. NPDC023587 TaxID=3154695 RepID=UPI0033D7A90F